MKKLKSVRREIRSAIKEVVNHIVYNRFTDIEYFLDDDTLLTVQLSLTNNEFTLNDVQLERQRYKDVVYDNISDWIFKELEEEVNRINMNNNYHMDNYTKDYETIGGKYAHQSYS